MTKRQTHLGASAKDVRSTAAKGLKGRESNSAKEAKSVAATALTQRPMKSGATSTKTASVRVFAKSASGNDVFAVVKSSPAAKALATKAPAAKAPAAKAPAIVSGPVGFIETRGRGGDHRADRTQPPAKAFSFRIDEKTVGLIDQAAEAIGQTRTEFVLASARERATHVLLDQTLFRLSAADWEAFSAALDEPAAPNEELKQFLARKSPWEE
jgi:uncharacterized protein (DUF1778 family)